MNIVLVGYRCSGKTTVGKLLARDLKREFLDIDRLIEGKTGLPIHSYVSQKGWRDFRAVEKEVVSHVASKDDLVIATGGGVVIDRENVRNLKKNGWVVWLKAKPSVIRDRMNTEEKPGELRPSLSGMDPLEEIDQILHERTPFYASTRDHTVNTNGQSPEKVARAIMKAFSVRDKYPIRGAAKVPGNSFGQVFKITTFGESHGKGIGVIIDGCPSRIPLLERDFIEEMARRRPGRTPFDTPRVESDQVEILSGVFEGFTTGTPIALLIRNRDVKSEPYEILRELFRPGHADYTYFKKYGHFDFRGGGRSSARETAARVAAGVVAQKVLAPLDIGVTAYTLELGSIRAENIDLEAINTNPFYCPDVAVIDKMREVILRAKEEGDSIGGIVEVRVSGCPAGLGEPVFDKLSADLAKGVMSVGAVKGVEIGAGFEAARLKGSQNNDPITPAGFKTNRAGGILGGISNGDDIILRAAVKPIPSIMIDQETIDREGKPAKLKLTGRFDISAVPRIVPVLEAMVAMVLADHYLRSKTIS